MTRISYSYRIVQAPCCGAEYRTNIYASINFTAYEYWTDGQNANSLFSFDGGLRHCTCGQYFLLQNCDHLRVIPAPKPRAPVGWQNLKNSWWDRLLHRPSINDIIRNYDTRSEEDIAASLRDMPIEAQVVSESDLPIVIEKCDGKREILIEARRRLWRSLNDPFRKVYRAHKVTSPETYPPYDASYAQKENMLKLAYLLEESYSPNWIEVSELCREVGDMGAAKEALKISSKSEKNLIDVIGGLIAMNYSGPVRYR
jgi:hypothetical protein